VVALIGESNITEGELDTEISGQMAQLEEQYHKQKFEMRRQGLEQMIIERLVKAEAKKKNLTEEAYLKAEVNDQTPAPAEEQLRAQFEQIKSQLPPGVTYDNFRERMTQKTRQDKARALFESLKKEAHVQIKMTEPKKSVEAKGPARGPNDAKVTIVEFSDFQCPFCGRAHDTVEEVMRAYAGKVRLVFRHFPLEFHPYAAKAAEAAACANEQGKFWEYHDVLFANQQKLEVPQLKEHAGSVGLDQGKFTECLDSGRQAAVVKADQTAGSKVGVNGTPAFFINGVMLSGAQPMDEFRRVIDQELAN